MKCQNCDNQATFFHSRNINGDVTEAHLCNECAEKEGYSLDGFFSTTRLVNMSRFFDGFDELLSAPRLLQPRLFDGFPLFEGTRRRAAPALAEREAPRAEADIDRSLNARREINVLREKMRTAADAEDFETAARLRDEIKAIEGGI